MKTRTTLFLLILAAVAGAFVYWDYKKGTPTDEAREKGKRLLDFKAADVTRVEFVRSNQTILVEKTGEQWNIKQPLAVRADASAVGSLLDQVEFAERDRVFSEKELTAAALDEFNLSAGKERLRLTVRDKKGDRTILFGNETPTKEAVYAQVAGQKTASVVAKRIFESANASLDSLRSRTVLDFVSTAATRLELKQAEKLLELDRTAAKTNAEPRWIVAKPFACRADQQKVGDLLNDLAGLRVQDFVSEDPKELRAFQLDEPQRELTLWLGDKSQTLLLGRAPTNDAAKVFAKLKDAPSIFTLNADSVKKFLPQVNDLRDGHLLVFNESDIRRVEIARGAETISLVRTGSAWKVGAPKPFDAEDRVVRELLAKLGQISAKQFVTDVAADLAPYGLDKPAATVTIHGAGTNILGQILIGSLNTSNAVRYAKRPDEPFVYGVEHAVLGSLPGSAVACRDRRLGDWREDLITKFTCEKSGDRLVIERGPDKKWKLVEPSQGVLDINRLQQVLDLFSYLRADGFERDGLDNLAAYGLDQPVARVTVEDAGHRSSTIQIGSAKDNTVSFASWNDPALIFTLDSGSVAILTNRLVTVPMPAPAPVLPAPVAPATNSPSLK